jgi:hypothetical protein
MNNGTLHENPAESEARLEQDAKILWTLVYSLSGDEPEFESSEDKNFANILAEDFIDRVDSRLTVQQYIARVYELKRKQ